MEPLKTIYPVGLLSVSFHIAYSLVLGMIQAHWPSQAINYQVLLLVLNI